MATIVMESAKVIAACEETISRILYRRAKENEKMIATEMAKYHYTWYFKPYHPTREQALEVIRSYFYPSAYAWGDLDKAEKLLRLAKLGDPVTLTENDVSAIFQ